MLLFHFGFTISDFEIILISDLRFWIAELRFPHSDNIFFYSEFRNRKSKILLALYPAMQQAILGSYIRFFTKDLSHVNHRRCSQNHCSGYFRM